MTAALQLLWPALLLAWLGAGAHPAAGGGRARLAERALRLVRLWRGPAALRVTEPRLQHMTPEQRRIFLAGLQRRRPCFTDRLLVVSAAMLDVPYARSPLGEGAGRQPDPDPIIRFDAVDCTTYIEQCLALARARSLPEALGWLRRIRYLDGRMAYRWRKHFMEAQWLPANQRDGFMADITAAVAGDRVRWVDKRLDAAVWRRRRHPEKWPQLTAAQIPSGDFRLPIVPLDAVLELQRRIPAGTLVNVVRRDLASMPTRITHQGLMVDCPAGRCLRHAGRAGYARVVDEPLDHFVRRNAAYRKWPVDGFNLQRLLPAGGEAPGDSSRMLAPGGGSVAPSAGGEAPGDSSRMLAPGGGS
jgi:hypothetical protein